MREFIWMTDFETGQRNLFRTEAIDVAYIRQDKISEGFNHIGGSTAEVTGEPETRVLLRNGSYIAVRESPEEIYNLIYSARSITDA